MVVHRQRRRRPWYRRHRLALFAGFVGVLLVAGIAAGVALAPRHGPATSTASRYASLEAARQVRGDVRGEAKPSSVLSGAVLPAKPELYGAPISRIRISRIGVDAAVQPKNVTPDGTMQSPDGPDLVAWYDFTPKPGLGSNAVLSGHVDYINHGPAVFWDLKKLEDGDEIEVVLEDGVLLRYRVNARQLYDLDTIPMADVIAPTPVDTVTLITCGGEFAAGSYSHRLVLRATRSAVVKPGS